MTSFIARMNPLNWFKKKHEPIITLKTDAWDEETQIADIGVYFDGEYHHTVKTLIFSEDIIEKINAIQEKLNR